MSTASPTSERSRRQPSIPRSASLYEWSVQFLLLLSFGVGMFAFGAVRLWSIGPLAALSLIAAILFFLRPVVFRADIPSSWPPGVVPLAVFTAYAAAQIPAAAVPYEAWVKFMMIATVPAAYVAWAGLAGRGDRWRWVFGIALLLIAIVGGYAIVQECQGSRMVLNLERPTDYEMRASGTYFCPNHFANMMAMGACLAFGVLLTPDAGYVLKLIAGYTLAMTIPPIYLSQSRSGMLGLAAGVAVTLWMIAWRRSVRLFLLSLILIPLLLCAGGWLLWSQSAIWKERVRRVVSLEDIRPTLWKDAVTMIRAAPVLGHGGGSYRWVETGYQTYTHQRWAMYAHNEYLHMGMEYGLLGLALFGAVVATVAGRFARRVRGARRERDGFLAAAALGVGACTMVHALFDYNFHIYSNSHFLVLTLGCIAGVLHSSGALPNRPLPRPAVRALAWGGAAVCLALSVGLVRAMGSYAWLFPADAARESADYAKAEQCYRRARAWDGFNWRAPLGLANVWKNRAAYVESDPETKNRLIDESIALYEKTAPQNPWEPAFPHGLSHLYSMKGDQDRALALLGDCIRIVPARPFYYTRLGTQLRRMGRDDEAETAFRKALSIDPTDATAKLNLKAIELKKKSAVRAS